jgi:hypothetical protein
MPPARNRTVKDARRRARTNLAERRRQQDRLIDAVTEALAARDRAIAAITASQDAIDTAVAALAELGKGGQELARILDVAAPERRGAAQGHAPGTPSRPADPAIAERGDGAVRLWLAMIERGPAPKTHGLDRDGGLLCRGKSEPGQLTTWVGYPFDVDCHRCVKLLAGQLTEEEFG